MNRMKQGGVRFFTNSAKVNAAVRVVIQGPVRILTMNRPKQKNAVNHQMWEGLIGAISEARSDPTTNVIAIRGNEDSFCSGLDLLEYKEAVESNSISLYAKNTSEYLRNLTASLIDCEKPIVALVRGNAVGIGVTLLPLCDLVYTSDKATFTTPFARLGIAAECCSSYTFPKIMGFAKSSSLLYYNQTIDAHQAQQWGLASDVLGDQEFDPETTHRVYQLARLPSQSLLYSKKLVRSREREILHEVNREESQANEIFLQSQETMEAVQDFFNRRK